MPAAAFRSLTNTKDLWSALCRSAYLLLPVAIFAGALSYHVLSMMAPRYEAEAKLSVWPKGQGQPSSDPSTKNFHVDHAVIEGHVEALRSDRLALSVAKDFKLENRAEFNSARGDFDAWGRLLRRWGFRGPSRNESDDTRVLKQFHDAVSVYSPPDGQSIHISVTSTVPELAAMIANRLATVYRQELIDTPSDKTTDQGLIPIDLEMIRAARGGQTPVFPQLLPYSAAVVIVTFLLSASAIIAREAFRTSNAPQIVTLRTTLPRVRTRIRRRLWLAMGRRSKRLQQQANDIKTSGMARVTQSGLSRVSEESDFAPVERRRARAKARFRRAWRRPARRVQSMLLQVRQSINRANLAKYGAILSATTASSLHNLVIAAPAHAKRLQAVTSAATAKLSRLRLRLRAQLVKRRMREQSRQRKIARLNAANAAAAVSAALEATPVISLTPPRKRKSFRLKARTRIALRPARRLRAHVIRVWADPIVEPQNAGVAKETAASVEPDGQGIETPFASTPNRKRKGLRWKARARRRAMRRTQRRSVLKVVASSSSSASMKTVAQVEPAAQIVEISRTPAPGRKRKGLRWKARARRRAMRRTQRRAVLKAVTPSPSKDMDSRMTSVAPLPQPVAVVEQQEQRIPQRSGREAVTAKAEESSLPPRVRRSSSKRAAAGSVLALAKHLQRRLTGEGSLRIMVTMAKPIIDCSQEVLALTHALADQGHATLIVEGSRNPESISQRLQLVPSPGLAEYLSDKATTEDVVRPISGSKVQIMPVGRSRVFKPSYKKLPQAFDRLESQYEVIVVTAASAEASRLLQKGKSGFDVVVVVGSTTEKPAATIKILGCDPETADVYTIEAHQNSVVPLDRLRRVIAKPQAHPKATASSGELGSVRFLHPSDQPASG